MRNGEWGIIYNEKTNTRYVPKILGGRYIQIHMLPLSFREYFGAYPECVNTSRISMKVSLCAMRCSGME